MGELINGRRPAEIKSGLRNMLETCADISGIKDTICQEMCCSYDDDNCCHETILMGALSLIERLESEHEEFERIESERDAALAKQPKWISVKERLPESGVHVFVLCEIRANGGIVGRYVCDGFHVEAWKEKAGCYSEDCAVVYNDEDDEYYLEEGWYEVIKNWEEYNSITIADFVTHWMHLPQPPEEE